MKITQTLTLTAILIGGISTATAATVSVSGLVQTLTGFDGDTIADGSNVEIGYFLGIDSSKEPATYSADDWSSFERLANTTTATVFFGFIPGGVDLSGTRVDSNDDFPTSPLPVRIGLRIFDSESGLYNTFTTAGSKPILELTNPFVPGTGDADLTTEGSTTVWEDSANPFKTTLVPEPSSALSLLLGAGLLLGARRR